MAVACAEAAGSAEGTSAAPRRQRAGVPPPAAEGERTRAAIGQARLVARAGARDHSPAETLTDGDYDDRAVNVASRGGRLKGFGDSTELFLARAAKDDG
jgi:hypothetical protein